MSGEKKIAWLIVLGLVVMSLIPTVVRPLTYSNIDWVQLGHSVYHEEPTPDTPPQIYLPETLRR